MLQVHYAASTHAIDQGSLPALHAACKLAKCDLALPLQRAHDRATALGQAPEEHAWTLKVEHLALVRARTCAPAGLAKRGLPVRRSVMVSVLLLIALSLQRPPL
jgi:hypothetical protein